MRPILAALLLAAACDRAMPVQSTTDPARMLRNRPYVLDVPPGAGPLPLLIALHGQGGSGEEIAQDLQLRAEARNRGYLLAMPDGTFNSQRFAWWNATTNGLPPYDRIYLQAMIDDIRTKLSVDPNRIYLAGYSIGALMAYRVACDHPDEIAAVVSFAGAVTSDPALCAAGTPVSVIEIHGDHDDVITYDGGPFIGGAQSGPSAHDTVRTWARNDRCTGSLAPTGEELDLDPATAGNETAVDAYGGCPAGVDVELWTMRGVGHSPDLQPGVGARVLDWLDAHPKR